MVVFFRTSIITYILIFLTNCTGFQPLVPKESHISSDISVETGNVSLESVSDTSGALLFSSPVSQQAFHVEETDTLSIDARNLFSHSPRVRIALAQSVAEVTISSTHDFEYHIPHTQKKGVLPAGSYHFKKSGSHLLLKGTKGKQSIPSPLLLRLPYGESWSYRGSEYAGDAVIRIESGGILLLNILPVEEYLRGVVPLEIGKRSFKELEALKAQAVAARTYTYSRMKERQEASFDLLATVADQVYGGVGKAQVTTDSAIITTVGEVLVDKNKKLIGAFYHSTCGGKTASINEVWNGASVPYLQAVSDKNPQGKSWCSASPKMSWTVQWEVEELSDIIAHYSTLLNEPAFRGTIQSIEVVSRTTSGRVAKCKVVSEYGTYYYGKDKIRQIFRRPQGGAPLLWSSSFTISKRGNTIIAQGQGFGHGIGMCQYGALGRARGGQSYKQILDAYYHGAHLEKVIQR